MSSVALPVSAEVSTDPALEPEAVNREEARRVLVVDDNQDAAELLAAVVELMGHEVKVAYDGAEALEVASHFRPWLVLMDIGMPRMDGYQAAAKIRSESWGQSMILIALTGWGQETDKERAREAGFDQHLVKPVTAATIEAVLSSVGQRKEA